MTYMRVQEPEDIKCNM